MIVAVIISAVSFVLVGVFAWALCRAASEWDHWEEDDHD